MQRFTILEPGLGSGRSSLLPYSAFATVPACFSGPAGSVRCSERKSAPLRSDLRTSAHSSTALDSHTTNKQANSVIQLVEREDSSTAKSLAEDSECTSAASAGSSASVETVPAAARSSSGTPVTRFVPRASRSAQQRRRHVSEPNAAQRLAAQTALAQSIKPSSDLGARDSPPNVQAYISQLTIR